MPLYSNVKNVEFLYIYFIIDAYRMISHSQEEVQHMTKAEGSQNMIIVLGQEMWCGDETLCSLGNI